MDKRRKNRNTNSDFENIFGLETESSTSESSSDTVMGRTNPYVLDLHEIKRDDAIIKTLPEAKGKKLRKKKKGKQESTKSKATSSSSPSEESVPHPSTDSAKEEFYDAQGSVHAMPDDKIPTAASPVATAAILQVQSQHTQDPKAEQAPQPTAPQAPTAITKPVKAPRK